MSYDVLSRRESSRNGEAVNTSIIDQLDGCPFPICIGRFMNFKPNSGGSWAPARNAGPRGHFRHVRDQRLWNSIIILSLDATTYYLPPYDCRATKSLDFGQLTFH